MLFVINLHGLGDGSNSTDRLSEEEYFACWIKPYPLIQSNRCTVLFVATSNSYNDFYQKPM